MTKARTTPITLPPRHGGYRAVANPTGQRSSQDRETKRLPTPPTGKGGSSKVAG